jgi:hypothetical protein
VRLIRSPRQRPAIEDFAHGCVVVLHVKNSADPATGTGEAGSRRIRGSTEDTLQGLNVGH